MIRTTSPETAQDQAQRQADSPDAVQVEGGLGDVMVALVAAVLPLLFALYAILTTGRSLEGRWKFVLIGCSAGVYSLTLVGVGVRMIRSPARALAGRTLIVCAGVLAAMLAAAGWFISGQGILPVVVANATGAAVLALVAALAHARSLGERPGSALILAAAVLLLGLSGGRNVVVSRTSMMVLDAAAALLACGVFVRPGRGAPALGRVVLALAIPASALLLRPLFESTRLFELGGFAGGLLWALRVVRPRLYHGSTALLAAGLSAAVLFTALPTPPSRHLLAMLALAALLLLDHDVRQDVDAGPFDRHLLGWTAGAVWLVLAATWARDLGLLTLGLGLPRGLHPQALPWIGLLALPLAAPAFALAWQRLSSAPPEAQPDPDAVSPGAGAEVLGWLVLVGGVAVALAPTPQVGLGWVGVAALAAAAALALAWSLLRRSPARLATAHLLLVAAVWAAALRTGRPGLALAPLAVAAALAATPLLGGRRSSGLVGGILLPLLAIEALIRHTTLAAEVRSEWLPGWLGPAARLTLGALAALAAWRAVLAAGRQRQQAVAALEAPPGQEQAPASRHAPEPGVVFEGLAWIALAVAAALALLPFPAVDPASTVLLLATTAVAAVWTRLGGSPVAAAFAGVLLVLDAWLASRWLGRIGALAAPAAALLLSLAPLVARRLPAVAPRVGWVGFVLFPLALAEAIIVRQAPALPAAGLLAVFGLVHLVTPPHAAAWTRAAGPPGVVLAGYLVAAGITGATWGVHPLTPAGLVPALAGALAALAAWAALAAGPVAIGIEALLGSLTLLAATASPLALPPLLLLAAGRAAVLARAAALALVAAGTLAVFAVPGRLPIAVAAAALAAGGAALLRRTPSFAGAQVDMSAVEVLLERLRRVGPAAIAAGALVLLLAPGPGGATWLAGTLWPAAAATIVLVAAVWVRVWGRPSFLAAHTVGAGLLAAAATIIVALTQPMATTAGAVGVVAGLVCLLAAVVAAGRLPAEAAKVIWGFAALGAPLAVIPLAGGPLRWPVALLAAGEVVLLGAASRRRASPVLASWTLWLGLLVAVWLAAAVLARLHPQGDALVHATSLAFGAALAGGLTVAAGSRWLAAPALFLQPYVHTCLWLAAAAAVLAAAFGPLGTVLERGAAALALVTAALLAAAVAIRHATGFPWLIAGAVLAVGYLGLRLRTPWGELLARVDGLLAVAAALLATLAERRLHTPEPEGPPGAPAAPALDPRLPPDEFPAFRAPGERELGWLATALAGASVVSVFQPDVPIHWAAIGPLLGTLLMVMKARHAGPVPAAVAAALFSTTISVALARWQVASYAAYAVPIAGAVAIWVQVFRDRLGFDAAVRAVPAAAAAGLCALNVFQAPAVTPVALLAGVGLLTLVAGQLWRERSHLAIGLACLVIAAVAMIWFIPGAHRPSDALALLSAASGLRLLPALSLLAVAVSALLLSRSDRWVDQPLEILHARVRAGLGLAAVLAAAALLLAPVRGAADVALALASVVAVGALAVRLAPRLPAGWPLLLAGAGAVAGYAYLRVRSGWLPGWQRWDGVVAVAAAAALVPVERLLRRAGPAPDEPAPAPGEDDPDRWPFGVREVRMLATALACLSAVALLQRQTPLDTLAPLLAVLLLLLQARGGHPIPGLLAVLYLNATIALGLWDRQVTTAAPFALPLAVCLTLLLHAYRGHLGSDEAVVRTLPAIGAAGACVHDAMTTTAVLIPTVELAAIGLTLLLLSRRWRMRPYVPVGLACVGAALLMTITDWNARGWTVSAIAIGTATLLVPAVLLRRRG